MITIALPKTPRVGLRKPTIDDAQVLGIDGGLEIFPVGGAD
jgi:hypothetical protein